MLASIENWPAAISLVGFFVCVAFTVCFMGYLAYKHDKLIVDREEAARNASRENGPS